jgi:iron complex outermembrane receptor protein
VKENARCGRTWNYGPFGGFTTVDVAPATTSTPSASARVVNLFDTKCAGSVAHASHRPPVFGRLKVMLPALGKK